MDKVTAKEKKTKTESQIGEFFGQLYSFNNSLKLYHWHVTGKCSYAQHMALDQALETLGDAMDRIVETTYAMKGDITVEIPSTKVPDDIVKHCEGFYDYVEDSRKLLSEDFSDSIIDDYQEATQQLLYRLKRLQ